MDAITICDKNNVTVVCNQTHKVHSVKACKLSLEEGDITEQDLIIGKQLMLEDNRNYYPVTLLSIDDSRFKCRFN